MCCQQKDPAGWTLEFPHSIPFIPIMALIIPIIVVVHMMRAAVNYQWYVAAGMRLVIPFKASVSPCVSGRGGTSSWNWSWPLSDLTWVIQPLPTSYQRCTMAAKTHVICLKILNNVYHIVSHCFSNLPRSCLEPKHKRGEKKKKIFLRFIAEGKGINRCTVRVEMLSLFNGMHRADIMSEIVSGRKPFFLSAPFIPTLEMK